MRKFRITKLDGRQQEVEADLFEDEGNAWTEFRVREQDGEHVTARTILRIRQDVIYMVEDVTPS